MLVKNAWESTQNPVLYVQFPNWLMHFRELESMLGIKFLRNGLDLLTRKLEMAKLIRGKIISSSPCWSTIERLILGIDPSIDQLYWPKTETSGALIPVPTEYFVWLFYAGLGRFLIFACQTRSFESIWCFRIAAAYYIQRFFLRLMSSRSWSVFYFGSY